MFKYEHDFIDIVEVGPRDGLQNEKEILSIEQVLTLRSDQPQHGEKGHQLVQHSILSR